MTLENSDAVPIEDGHGRRILVVDDSEDAARSMAKLLKLVGNDVRTVHDGIEAVAAAEEFRPEIILMDIGMPRLNGYEATRRIRQRPWGRSVRIIAVSGWGQENDKVRSQEAGCDGHLVKPVRLPDLVELLAGLRQPTAQNSRCQNCKSIASGVAMISGRIGSSARVRRLILWCVCLTGVSPDLRV